MKTSVIIHCLIVSAIVAVAASFLSTTIAVAPAQGEIVFDMEATDWEVLKSQDDVKIMEHMTSLPQKQVSGLQRYTYALEHPDFFIYYLKAALTWFIGLLCATVLVSYLNARST